MKDLYNNINIVSVLDPIAVSATATYTDIDLEGADSCCLIIHVGLDAGSGLSGSHKLVYTLYDSPDGTTYTLVTTADMVNLTVASGVVLTIDAVGEDNSIYKLGYIGGKRYLELIGTETGTVSCPIGIILVKGDPRDVPEVA